MRYFAKVDAQGDCMFTTSSPKPTNTAGLIELTYEQFMAAPGKRLVAGKWENRPAPEQAPTLESRLAAIEAALSKLATLESKIDEIKSQTAKAV